MVFILLLLGNRDKQIVQNYIKKKRISNIHKWIHHANKEKQTYLQLCIILLLFFCMQLSSLSYGAKEEDMYSCELY